MLCWFLPCISMNQAQAYVCPLPFCLFIWLHRLLVVACRVFQRRHVGSSSLTWDGTQAPRVLVTGPLGGPQSPSSHSKHLIYDRRGLMPGGAGWVWGSWGRAASEMVSPLCFSFSPSPPVPELPGASNEIGMEQMEGSACLVSQHSVLFVSPVQDV